MVPTAAETLRSTLQRLVHDHALLERLREMAVFSQRPGQGPPQREDRAVPDRRNDTRHLPGGRRAGDKWRDGVIDQPPSDRRRETRYIPIERRAYLGWWDGDTFRPVAARFENLSQNGSALLVDEFPEGVDAVWLCLIGPVRPDWHAARVIGVSSSGGTGRVVRIALVESLPYDIFKAIVWGFPGETSSDDRLVTVVDSPQGPGEAVRAACHDLVASARLRARRPARARGRNSTDASGNRASAGRVLVVEAEMSIRFTLRLLFERRGWEVTLARGVEEGLAALNLRPNWIIMDPALPDGDGEEILRMVREGGFNTRVAIVASHLPPDVFGRLSALEPDLLVDKPIQFDGLLAACAGSITRFATERIPGWLSAEAESDPPQTLAGTGV